MIVLRKTGYDHLDMGKNCQDIAFATTCGKILFGDEKKADFDFILSQMDKPAKFVLDGCGSTPFSEVGVALFAQMFPALFPFEMDEDVFIERAQVYMDHLSNFIVDTDRFRRDNLSFTILVCFETETDFIVNHCGDGYVIAITHDEKIEAIRLDDAVIREDGEYPTYLVYNCIENRGSLLKEHRDEVGFKRLVFGKKNYVNVGVATDGWRYVDTLDALERVRFDESLLADKAKKLSIIINRNLMKFKDDFSICI